VHLLLQEHQIAALAAGISEALINATGIGTSAVAIISYNFFTQKLMI
jgi:biopolymer transport protein ExbB